MDDQQLLIVAVGVLVFACYFLFARVKHSQLLNEDTGKDDLNSDLPVKTQKARILSKIEPENPNGIFFGFAHIVFETEENERIKLAITDKNKYDDIIVGDNGILSTKGNAFVNFERNKDIGGTNE